MEISKKCQREEICLYCCPQLASHFNRWVTLTCVMIPSLRPRKQEITRKINYPNSIYQLALTQKDLDRGPYKMASAVLLSHRINNSCSTVKASRILLP